MFVEEPKLKMAAGVTLFIGLQIDIISLLRV